ncbi:MAG: hypothetical protein ABI883_01025 [Chthoniobacterales bacterium]
MSENDEIDWSLTTWEGSRRAQLRDAMKLTLTEKWQAVEEMGDWARATITSRRARGLAYIDPYTGERVPGAVVREEPPTGSP